MAVETFTADRWLAGVLEGDPTLSAAVSGVHSQTAPQGTTGVYVVFRHQGGFDVTAVGPNRIMASLVYLVKAVTAGQSFGPLVTAANRLDTLLHAASGSVVGGEVFACVREQPWSAAYEEDGVSYREAGGIYRLLAQS